MRFLPFAIRDSEDTRIDAEIEVALIMLRHPDEPEPWRICSDNKVRVASFPQPRYASFSRWQSDTPAQYDFVPMGVVVADEGEEAADESAITIVNSDARLIELLIAQARREVTADIAVVMASDPDTILYERRGLEVMSSEFSPAMITVSCAPAPVLDEQYPADNITEERFPALFAQ